MSEKYGEELNTFLVKVFNDILKTEELCVSRGGFSDISLKEIHVIEAVYEAENEDNSASAVAKRLRITAGTLTTAVSMLEKKGYISKRTDAKDKRVVRLYTTDKGKKAQENYMGFHRDMVESVIKALSQEELRVFIRALSGVSAFFSDKYLNG